MTTMSGTGFRPRQRPLPPGWPLLGLLVVTLLCGFDASAQKTYSSLPEAIKGEGLSGFADLVGRDLDDGIPRIVSVLVFGPELLASSGLPLLVNQSALNTLAGTWFIPSNAAVSAAPGLYSSLPSPPGYPQDLFSAYKRLIPYYHFVPLTNITFRDQLVLPTFVTVQPPTFISFGTVGSFRSITKDTISSLTVLNSGHLTPQVSPDIWTLAGALPGARFNASARIKAGQVSAFASLTRAYPVTRNLTADVDLAATVFIPTNDALKAYSAFWNSIPITDTVLAVAIDGIPWFSKVGFNPERFLFNHFLPGSFDLFRNLPAGNTTVYTWTNDSLILSKTGNGSSAKITVQSGSNGIEARPGVRVPIPVVVTASIRVGKWSVNIIDFPIDPPTTGVWVQPTVWASLRDRSQWATLLALALTVVAKLSCFPTPRTIRGRRLL